MKSDPIKFCLVLAGCQLIASILIFSEFLSGKFFFAYLDIGSDSYKQVFAGTWYLARTMLTEGFTGWSFQIGLGGPTTALMGDLASLLVQSTGPNIVLQARIFVYLTKLALGGIFFLFFIRHFVQRWETAVISAIAYSFCGFIVINGQWDGEATAFVFYPLVLWAITQHRRPGCALSLPIAVALSLLFGTFFVSLGVFLVFSCLLCIACSDKPQSMALDWIRKIFPLAALGYLLASPYLVPVVLQLMDTSRVSGGQSLVQSILNKSVAVSDWQLIVAQVGGLFHKDLFGVGNAYRGYFNYLEGPGFYFGFTLLILIPQLWSGSQRDRRLLAVGVIAFVAYVLFPVFRFAAMGFAAPYFRVSTLWITILELMLAAKALDLVLTTAVNLRLLFVGVLVSSALLLFAVLAAPPETIWFAHVWRVIGITSLSTLVLVLFQQGWITANRLPLLLMLLAVVEAVLIARPSFVQGRTMVDGNVQGYNDKTLAALTEIRKLDHGVFRIEKDYNSVSLADAMAQDYMGIKSYSLHSRGMVDFHIGAGLLPTSSPVVNYTNWLSNAGERFVLNSLLGVKYFVAVNPVSWPGFTEVPNESGLRVYRNEFALPLGIVQTRQITKDAYQAALAEYPSKKGSLIDAMLFNAAVVDHAIPGFGTIIKVDELSKSDTLSLEDLYFAPAAQLQKTGLQIHQFASNRIVGEIHPTSSGVLTLSIPYNDGWRLKVDGVEAPIFRVNFGMLGATVVAGNHAVELDYVIPGLRLGIQLGLMALLLLAGLGLMQFRRNHNP